MINFFSKILTRVKSKALFLVSMLLILAFTFFITYLLNQFISFEDTKYFGTFFWWVRIIIAAMYLLCGLYLTFSSKDVSGKAWFMAATLGIQWVPFVIRLLGLINNEKVAVELSVLVLFLVGIPYFFFVFYLLIATDKIKIAQRETKAQVKKAKDEDSYYDKDGNFVGNKKK